MSSSKADKAAIMRRLYHEPRPIIRCDDCAGWTADPPTYEAVRLPKTDADGFPIFDRDGNMEMVAVRVKRHVLPRSDYDPLALGPAACTHGVDKHPTYGDRPRGGLSWIRVKYLAPDGTCPVDRGEPAPEDLTGALPA